MKSSSASGANALAKWKMSATNMTTLVLIGTNIDLQSDSVASCSQDQTVLSKLSTIPLILTTLQT